MPSPRRVRVFAVDPVTRTSSEFELPKHEEPEPDEPCISALWSAQSPDELRAAIGELLTVPGPHEKRASRLRAFWIEKGLHVREHLQGDSILLAAYRHLYPPYCGDAVRLYRGELKSRYEAGEFGFAWSARLEVASMFALRFTELKEGPGVVLQIDARPEMIIAGPPQEADAIREYEYIVDPQRIAGITIIPALPLF